MRENLFIKKCFFSDVCGFGDYVDNAQNFLDHLSKKNDSEIETYQFYSCVEDKEIQAIACLSSENNLSLYSKTSLGYECLLDYFLSSKIKVDTIFSGDDLSQLLLKEASISFVKAFSFYNMSKKVNSKINCRSDYKIYYAKETDQAFIDSWYKQYNKEEGTLWLTPDLAKEKVQKLYFMKTENDFVAGCANSMISDKHFWIGRLYVDKKHRRKGLAKTMMDYMENLAFDCKKSLNLQVFDENHLVMKFYKDRGYKIQSKNSFWVREDIKLPVNHHYKND